MSSALLATLDDASLGFDTHKNKMRKRESARAVVMLGNDVILMYNAQHEHFLLPGGRREKGEAILDTLVRKVREETGYNICDMQTLGSIIERRSQSGVIETSNGFLVNAVGPRGSVQFTEKEKAQGIEVGQHYFDAHLFCKRTPTAYRPKFIVTRDCLFMQEAAKFIYATR